MIRRWMMRYFTVFSLLLVLITVLPQSQLQAQSVELGQGTVGIAWSPDATRLATANPGGRVYIWGRSGELLRMLDGHERQAASVAWSPDGKLLATGGTDAFIRIWDANTGELIREVASFRAGTFALAWQPTGRYLIANGFEQFQAWDTSTWQAVTEAPAAQFWDLKWRPNGSDFAYAGPRGIGLVALDVENNNIRALDVTFERLHTSPVYGVNWSPDGSQLVSAGGSDGSVRLWSATTGKQIRVLLQTEEIVTDVMFTDDKGTQVTVITDEGNIYVLDALTGNVEQKLTGTARLWDINWNSKFDLLAISGLSAAPENAATTNSETNAINTIDSVEAVASTGFLEIFPISDGTNRLSESLEIVITPEANSDK